MHAFAPISRKEIALTLKILDQKLKLTIEAQDAKPNCSLNQDNVGTKGEVAMCHLTKGFNGFEVTDPAFTGSVTVPLSFEPKDKPKDWRFGFLQIAKLVEGSVGYNGRTENEGSVVVKWNIPPNLANITMLDRSSTLFNAGQEPPDPWAMVPDNLAPLPNVRCEWADHPAVWVPLKLSNSACSNVPNFLALLLHELHFFTIFTAQDPGGAFHYIAFFFFQVSYEFHFSWKAGRAEQSSSNSFIDLQKATISKGRPSGPDIDPLLADPLSKPNFNDVLAQSQKKSFLIRGPNHIETENFWLPGTRADFWRD